jgi:Tol biopolymer transport system component
MSLSAGTRLGPYVIEAAIGAGGMGEVYRASDTNLARQVAIKVLPEAVAQDAERLARFEREAKTLASLNHPHIAQIHGLERADGRTALVMELVEGPTLADRIARGPLPIDEALSTAKQIAEALEAAHEQGIVHRDLKPANIKLRDDGTVKLLDFGLAKAIEPAAASGNLANSPTLTSPARTEMGVLLGTAAYMAPEQARGRSVDKRADIWAFGVVLYEMVTGRRLFEGEDLTETLANVVKQPPDLSAVPARLRRLLGRCLEKDPKKRLRDIGDAWELLDDAIPAIAPAPRSWPGWMRWALVGLFGAASAAAAVFAWLWLSTTAGDTLSAQFQVQPPAGTEFGFPYGATAISPDGRYVVFAAGPQGSGPLWLRPLDSLTARPLQGTEGANFPFWSPDSRSVAFYQSGQLARSDIIGGSPQVLCEATPLEAAGGTWNRDGTILFASQGGLLEVAASGGDPKPVSDPDAARHELEHGYPQFLPDGQHFLFLVRSADPTVQGIYAASLAQPATRVRILGTAQKVSYVPSRDGRAATLVWLRDRTLLAQPFDVGTLGLEGDPAPVAEDIALNRSFQSRAAFWTSDAGVLAYRTGDVHAVPTALTWFDRQGKVLGTIGDPEVYGELALSPDGTRVAAFRRDSIGEDLWLVDLARGSSTRLTTDSVNESYPVWSPDGRQIAFGAYPNDSKSAFDLYRKPAGASGQKDVLWKDGLRKRPTDWSRDGRFFLYSVIDASEKDEDIWALPLRDANPTPTKYLATEFIEAGGRFSPDTKWVVYTSNISGREEVYVSPFPDAAAAPAQMVSTEGGAQARWRPDGRAILYLSPDHTLMEVEVVRDAPFTVGIPKPLFQAPLASQPADPDGLIWDVSPDGQRFLLNRGSDQAPPVPLTVVTNWQATLQKLR